MRIVSLDEVMSGSIIKKRIYGSRGEVLLEKDTVLTSRYIARLKRLGISSCYIEGNASEGIDFPKTVSETIRTNAIKNVTDFYQAIADNHHNPFTNWKSISELVDGLLDEMLNEDGLILDMTDLKTFDNYTFSHCVSVAFLSVATGIELGLTREDLYHLAMGALMHDVGKMFIPIEIINKPGKLTDEEYKIIQLHSEHGYKYLSKTGEVSEEVCQGVLCHHERIDGKGYPLNQKGHKINLFGKIYAVCDVYDAITSDRPYRKAWSLNEGYEYLMANGGISFDNTVLRAFFRHIVLYPVGSVLTLSNGFKAIVEANNKKIISRPIVRIIEEHGEAVKPYTINLGKNSDYFNVTIVSS